MLASLLSSCGSEGTGESLELGAASPDSSTDGSELDSPVKPVAVALSDDTQFIVRAIDRDGAGPWSQPIAFNQTLLNDYTSDDSLNSVDELVQSSLWIEWQHNPEALGYEFRAIDPSTGSILGEHTLAAADICAESSCRVLPTTPPDAAESSVSDELVASIDETFIEGSAPQAIQLTAIVPTSLEGALSYQWSIPGQFVDNNTDRVFLYTFETPGNYQVKLTATDSSGFTATSASSVRVSESVDSSNSGDTSTDAEEGSLSGVFTASVENSPIVNLGAAPVLYIASSVPVATVAEQEITTNSTVAQALTPATVSNEEIATTSTTTAPVVDSAATPDSVVVTVPVEPTIAAESPETAPATATSTDTIAPTITSIVVNSTDDNSAIISWDLTEYATGQVEFGRTEDLGNTSRKETSFQWASHIQRIEFLESGTDYFFRVLSADASGNAVVSDINTFTTTGVATAQSSNTSSEPIAPAEDWPANANGELPLAGIFYGNYMPGTGAQNAGIGVESSRRFRAERTGLIEFVRYHNRTLNMKNINDRCDSNGPGSDWCNCVDNGLDEYTCGYTLGSSYSVGNGGTLVVELRTAAADGKPSDVVLGKTSPFVPMDNSNDHYPELEFTSPIQIHEGHLYHLVFVNLNPPTSCSALVRIDPTEASSCPTHQGAQGLNGPRLLSVPSQTGLRGPYLGDLSAANYFKRSASSSWKFYSTNLSWYEVGYTDGVAIGDSYTSLDSTSTAEHVIGGSTKVRQIFTVQDTSRQVDGIWLNTGYTKTSDGSSMSVRLKDASGSTLATGVLEASQYCRDTISADEVTLAHWCEDWIYTSFGKTVSLLEGSTYSVEFSASTAAGFKLAAYESLSTHGFKDRNDWVEARAQISDDNGSSWDDWTVIRPQERDLALLFTIEGMPRQLK